MSHPSAQAAAPQDNIVVVGGLSKAAVWHPTESKWRLHYTQDACEIVGTGVGSWKRPGGPANRRFEAILNPLTRDYDVVEIAA